MNIYKELNKIIDYIANQIYDCYIVKRDKIVKIQHI